MSSKNLSESFLELNEENVPKANDPGAILEPMDPDKKKNEGDVAAAASDADVILKPFDPDNKENKISEQDENDTELPQKLSNILSRLEKKPTTQKVEMQGALIDQLLKTIQGLPSANRLLKSFINDATAIVLKGEEAPQ